LTTKDEIIERIAEEIYMARKPITPWSKLTDKQGEEWKKEERLTAAKVLTLIARTIKIEWDNDTQFVLNQINRELKDLAIFVEFREM
jgi:hypothetical protein